MKVLITATTYPRFKGDTIPGFVHSLAKNLVLEPGISEVHVLAPHDPNCKTDELMDGVHVHRYRYWWPMSGETISYGGGVGKIKKTPVYALKLGMLLLAQLFATYRMVRRHKIDVISAHWIIPMGFVAALVRLVTRTRVVVSVHGGDVFSLRGSIPTKFKRWTLVNTDHTIVNSSATLAETQKLLNRDDYTVLPMGIDPMEPLSKKRTYSAGQTLELLFVGRVAKEKGIQYALKAVARLKKCGKKVHFRIAGSGAYEATLKAEVTRLGLKKEVEFVGWTEHDDFPKLFSTADVFIGPSIILDNGWQEAFGLVFAESLSLNTPVIATTTGGIIDIVTDHTNGLLVEQQNVDQLADAIGYFIDHPAAVQEFANGARAAVTKKYAWSVIAKQYAQILSDQ